MIHPFNASGLSDMLAELYVLTDDQLMDEGRLATANFVSWLSSKFIFSAEQSAYLSNVPDKVQYIWGHLYAATLVTRGDIIMFPLPSNPPPRRTKETRQNINGEIVYNDNDQESVGTINIEIDWNLL